jgi:hypothetical protein
MSHDALMKLALELQAKMKELQAGSGGGKGRILNKEELESVRARAGTRA